ncbi:30S ribosomal protein S12 methylthiotransferase accessory factor YcaO [Thermithiobacillus plumbiphilus]|uniref:30S ribosomal protein S12 methylthiotransferase accessory factor YcaO n=1 Tax=Thermithiobacillus plumbiphilus TaxID=1729899 RepID=A0ABU9D571_9PROT
MSEQTYIKGKDRDLESSIQHMLDQLARHGFQIEEASWLNPVANVFSVHIRDRDCPLMYTNGKGASRKAALASALGEFFERLQTNYFWADYYLGEALANDEFVHYPQEQWFPVKGKKLPTGLLDTELWQFYNPEGELTPAQLVDTNSGHPERGICALPFLRQRDGETIWFPVNIVGNLYVSNGMSTGNSEAEARVQALSEIFERYVKNRIIAEGISLPDVPLDVIERFPRIREAITELEGHGYHILVKDASLGGQFPVMNVTMIDPVHGTCFASFGAHPSFEVALERTLTELLQGRSLERLDGFQAPTFDQAAVAEHHNLEMHFIDSSGLISYDFFRDTPDYPFSDWDFGSDTASEFAFLSGRIQALGFDIYIMDYQHLGMYSCRILVPGMSEIYPVEDLWLSNNNEGAQLRALVLHLEDLDEEGLEELLDALEEGGFSEHQLVAALIGVAPDPGSAWSSLTVGELKALIAARLDDPEAALEWVEGVLHSQTLGRERIKFYRALQALLEIELDEERDPDDYRANLVRLYGEQDVRAAEDLIAGEPGFPGLHAPGLPLDGLPLHGQLLDAYRKLHAAKAAFYGK